MKQATELRSLIERTEKIEPIDTVNGIPLVTLAEQRDIGQLAIVSDESLGLAQYDDDGKLVRTPVRSAAINLDSYYINRCKRVKDSYYIVTDYRAIRDIPSGIIYQKTIPAAVIKRNDKGKLYIDKVVMISDSELIADFTHTLNRESMADILPLLQAGIGVTAESLEI